MAILERARPTGERQRAVQLAFNKRRIDRKAPRVTGKQLLTQDEETRLCSIYQGQIPGDRDAALNELVRRNQGLIRKLAAKWDEPSRFPFEDCVQEATIGFITACGLFDGSRGNKLATMASHWITQAVSRARDQKEHLIHIPVHALDELRMLNRRLAELEKKLGHEPTEEEVQTHLHLSPQKVAHIRDLPTRFLDLDAPVKHQDGSEDALLIDLIAEPVASLDADIFCRDFDLRAVADGAINLLPEGSKEQDVIRRRMGFAPYTGPQTLQEIGDALGISRQGAQQVEIRAIKRIRQGLGLPPTVPTEKEERQLVPNSVPRGSRPRNFAELQERNDRVLAAVEGGMGRWEASLKFGIGGSRVREACLEARKRRGDA